MPTRLPIDNNNNPIPAMRLRASGGHSIAFSATSATNATPFNADTRIISLYATADVFIKFSDSASDTATTADHFFPAGVYYDFAIGTTKKENYGYIHVLRVNTNGNLYISEKE